MIPEDRYARQRRLPAIGDRGQARLAVATVAIIGMGALGCPVADLLARAGVGGLRIADRDLVELSNLQRQTLFTGADVGFPKADAAAARLAQINPATRVEAHATDVTSAHVEEFVAGASVIVDATDNAQSRYLVNDVSVKRGIPWVYGGAVGIEGRVAAFNPTHGGLCLRCVFRDPPEAGELPTCDTAGVLNALTATVGALQASAVLRLIVEPGWLPQHLTSVDAWGPSFRSLSLAKGRDPECPCCSRSDFSFLNNPSSTTTTLCGAGTLQVLPSRTGPVDLSNLKTRWSSAGQPTLAGTALRMEAEGLALTLFTDGRLLIRGLGEPALARAVYDRWVGT